MIIPVLPLAVGYILDLLIGDPVFLYHPVRIIGHLITALENILRKIFPKTEAGEKRAGMVLVVLVCVISTAVPLLILILLYQIHPVAGFVVESFFCYQLLATKSLKTESMKVYKELKNGNLEGSRKAVAMIVGRDTEHLDEAGVAKAAVETVAENTSDGIIAPMIYMAIGGAALGFFYKAVNTMDSMVGYKNENYLYFGRAAAKFDDLLNYLPARLSAWLMIAASGLIHMDIWNAKRIYHRDKQNHASPNSAQTEAVMAGALQIQLAGDAWYFGELHKKPTIGDSLRPIQAEDIKSANRLLYATSILSILIFLVIWAVIWGAGKILL